MLSLICVRINGWVNNREAGELRRHPGHYDVDEMASEVNLHVLDMGKTVALFTKHMYKPQNTTLLILPGVIWYSNQTSFRFVLWYKIFRICVFTLYESTRYWAFSKMKQMTTKPCTYIRGYSILPYTSVKESNVIVNVDPCKDALFLARQDTCRRGRDYKRVYVWITEGVIDDIHHRCGLFFGNKSHACNRGKYH